MKHIIYLRKSTDTEDKQVHSLADQKSVLLELAGKLELNVVGIYEESMSAKSSGRPVFNQVMSTIQSGEADALLVWKLDRLARNMIDGGLIMDLLQRGIIQSIQTHDKQYLPTDNVLMMAVELGMANQYVRDLSTNVKRGNREKLKRGEWPGQAPFGYLNDRLNKTIKINPKTAPYVVQMFELYATGIYSYADIQDVLYKQGLRTKKGNKVYKSIIQRVIHKSFYYGIMERGGETYVGNHEPLVTKELFEKCQRVAGVSTRPRKKTKGFTLSGFMTCTDCGCAITAEIKKEKYIYYHCTNGKGGCEQKRINTREELLQEQILGKFSDIHIDEELLEIVYQAKLEELNQNTSLSQHIEDTTAQELELLSKRRSRLVDTFTAGDIPDALYKEKLAEISRLETELENQIQNTPKIIDPYTTIELTKKAFLDASSLASRYFKAGNSGKRIILSEALSNSQLKNQHLANFSYQMPYRRLAELPQNAGFSQMLPDQDSNFCDIKRINKPKE